MNKSNGWFKASKDLQAISDDALRGRATSIPPLLRRTTLLLVRHGNEPITQYIYGDEQNIKHAGELSGFKITPLKDNEYPNIPNEATNLRHALIPWRARLNSTANIEKLRTDIHQIRRSIDTILPENSYLSITFRERGFFENRRIRSWISDEANSIEDMSDLVKSGSLLARVSVGCSDDRIARDVVENAARSLFSDMSDMSSHRSLPRLGLLIASLVGLLVSVCAVAWLVWLPLWLPLFFFVLMLVGGYRWWRRDVWDDVIQVPHHDWRWMARRRRARQEDRQTKLGVETHKSMSRGYPVHRSTLIVEPLGVMSLFMPVGTAQAVAQSSHPVPEILSRNGIYIGRDESDRPAYLDTDVLYGGLAAFGEPGSGKSALIHGIMQWAELHRQDTPSDIWGPDSRIISFDLKDDKGVEVMRNYEHHVGLDKPDSNGRPPLKTHAIYLSDPNSVGLDFLGLHAGKCARDTAVTLARTMQYSFDDGDIKGNSLEVLTRALTIGIACERHTIKTSNPATGRTSTELSRIAGGKQIIERIRRLEYNYPGAAKATRCDSVIGWALMALGNRAGNTGTARALGQVCAAYAQETGSQDWKDAALAAESLYGRPKQGSSSGTTISDRDFSYNVNSSMNKLTQLAADEHIFTSRRGRVTWEWILAHPGNYHIVAAPHNGTNLSEGMINILGAWMLYSLWNSIASSCQGWLEQGKHTMILCDELSLLATADATIPAGMREQGRAWGVISVIATQFGNQLPPVLLTSVMGYSTFVSFSIPDPQMAEMVAQRFGVSHGWTGESISNLPKYWAGIRSRTSQQLQPTYMVKVHDFDHDFNENARH